MASKTWRDYAKPIINRVIREVGTDDKKKLRKALRDAYPFGERRYYPYKVWLDGIKIQLGEKKRGPGRWPRKDDPRQKKMFE